jgi:hypothetical protein
MRLDWVDFIISIIKTTIVVSDFTAMRNFCFGISFLDDHRKTVLVPLCFEIPSGIVIKGRTRLNLKMSKSSMTSSLILWATRKDTDPHYAGLG